MRASVAIVGAGPYGLSLAAHLAAHGVGFRIFGQPMGTWSSHMPEGMCLKSDGFASDLYEPGRRSTLERFCAARGIAYDDLKIPVRLETFLEYGLEFQARFVPSLEPQLVTRLAREDDGFRLTLQDQTVAEAHRVVLATGFSHLEYVPEELLQLGPELCSHSSAHSDLSVFVGRQVLIVGGGASAADTAVLLHTAGVAVELVSRHQVRCPMSPAPRLRSLYERIRRPHLGLAPGVRSSLLTLFPGVFRRLSAERRMSILGKHLGPSAGWFLRDVLTGGALPVHEGYSLVEARRDGEQAVLRFRRGDGTTLEKRADHVIAATGYRIALERLAFLDPPLRGQIKVFEGYPVLSARFQSCVPGLYLVGPAAEGSFGPLMRFALGAEYASIRLAGHLARSAAGDRPEPPARAAASDPFY
jgi:hypothetical protein